MINLPLVIVAGGKSSRMGSDKALLPFGSFKTLTQYQLNRHKDCFSSLHVSCKNKDKFNFEANFIEDTHEFEEFSPLVALYSILKQFDSDVCILSVDTPFVTCRVFEKLFTCKEDSKVTLARSPFGSHQMCGIYSPTILEAIKENIKNNNHKIRDILKVTKTKYVDFDDDKIFTNLNYQKEYQEAQIKYAR
jgi:molybdopterin-guanine dinucleotide biosynthesis protein A